VVAQTDEFTKLILSVFTEAAFDLEMGNTRCDKDCGVSIEMYVI
jgi:hypothetical protein